MRFDGVCALALLYVSSCLTIGCRASDENLALDLCNRARTLEATSQLEALKIRRQVWQELPYSGTIAARDCGREIRERMGQVRTLVAHDELGASDTIDGCAWAADAMEVFADSTKHPYREHWARRLAERCVTVVGRAWTRDPDNQRLADLTARLKILTTDPSQ